MNARNTGTTTQLSTARTNALTNSWCRLNGFPVNVRQADVLDFIQEVLEYDTSHGKDSAARITQIIRYKNRSSVIVSCADAATAEMLLSEISRVPFDDRIITGGTVTPNYTEKKTVVEKKKKKKKSKSCTCMLTRLPATISEDALLRYLRQVMESVPGQRGDNLANVQVRHLLNGKKTSNAIVQFDNPVLVDLFLEKLPDHPIEEQKIDGVRCKGSAVLTNRTATPKREQAPREAASVRSNMHPTRDGTTSTTTHRESTTCMITRLPKSTNEDELIRYIRRVMELREDDPPRVNHMQHGNKRCKAIVRFGNEESLNHFLQTYTRHKYKDSNNVIKVTKCRPDAAFPRLEPNQTTHQKREIGDGEKIDESEALTCARGFHDYLCKYPDQMEAARDRDRAGHILAVYLGYTPSRKKEAIIMAQMRKERLLRSRRLESGQVLMVYADHDGAFSNQTTLIDTKEKMMKLRSQQEENKCGVRITNGITCVSVKTDDEALFEFEIAIEKGSTTVVLQGTRLTGTHAKMFQLDQCPFPLDLTDCPIRLKLRLKPSRVGCFRVGAHFEFANSEANETFSISRFMMVRASADPEMADALRPLTPYTRPVKKKFHNRSHVELYASPDHPGSSGGKKKEKKGKGSKTVEFNPFAKLPRYHVPDDIKELVVTQELGNILEKPEECVQGVYYRFWQHLLWASELQAKFDIQLYDMKQVSLKQEGRRYVLFVPGLAEARPSVLRGDEVHITWNNRLFKGRVVATRLLEVVLEFSRSFESQFNTTFDTVDVRFTFSRMTFRTSHEGCRLAETHMAPLLLPSLKDPDVCPERRSSPSVWRWANPCLNTEQQAAVEKIVRAEQRPLPYIIFGPPGTGKTTTVVETVYQLSKHEDDLRILLVAPSNDAADVLVERLSQYFPPSELCRVLAYSRTIDMLPAPIQRYAREKVSEGGSIGEILKMKIVVATVNYAARLVFLGIPRGHFDVLCVDEAGHATEPEVVSTAASIMDFTEESNRCGQLILAGDPKQLGPIVTSDVCRQFGLEKSYMERLTEDEAYSRKSGTYPENLITKLIRNYRSHPSILKLPNELFYEGDLITSSDFGVSHNLSRWEYLPRQGFPILFHSMEGENLREGNSPSWYNPQEAMQAVEYVDLLLNETRPPLRPEEIGIITPYHRQAQKIRLALDKKGIGKNIKVGSVEVFQGQERRCIILSTVRSETEYLTTDLRFNLGFVSNKKRFNVAITRAKALLIVIGCPRVLALDKETWRPFMMYCRENGGWAGDEWDPHADDEIIDLRDAEDDFESDDEDEEDEYDIVVAPSQLIQQGGTGFISREE